jgi:hypothetical protein
MFDLTSAASPFFDQTVRMTDVGSFLPLDTSRPSVTQIAKNQALLEIYGPAVAGCWLGYQAYPWFACLLLGCLFLQNTTAQQKWLRAASSAIQKNNVVEAQEKLDCFFNIVKKIIR